VSLHGRRRQAGGAVRATPDEQPEVGPRNSRRTCAAGSTFPTKEPAGTLIVDTSHTYLYYVLGGGRAIRYGVASARWLHLDRRARKFAEGRVAGLASADRDIERQPYLPRFMAAARAIRWARGRCISAHRLSHPRHQSALDHRQVRLVRLHWAC